MSRLPTLAHPKWPRGQYPIEIVGIAHYAYCNIKCSYCFLQTQDPSSYAPGLKPYSLLPVISELIRDGHLAPHAIIDWGGGEPTSYPEFDELLGLLLDHGTFHYIHTNGTRFPEPVRRAPHRVHVICSVDAGLPTTYVRLKQKDYLERVWVTLDKYLRAGVQVSLKYIMKNENLGDDDLTAFIDRASRIRAPEIILDIDYDFPVPAPAVIRALGRLKAMAQARGLYARFGFTGANFAPEHKIIEHVEEAFQTELHHWKMWLPRIVRSGRSLLSKARRLIKQVSGIHTATTSGTKECSNAAAKARPDEPGGVGRRVWHLPVAQGD
ncbi:MAG TPA: radical SAM protein [Gemmata sp.]|nr:radical SAM protein [Gemmata sp.]